MRNAIGTAIFFVVAPGTVVGLIPYLITRWRPSEPFLGTELTRWPGVVLIIAGLAVVLDAFARFVREGRGTPAPVAAPTRLVVRGPYRYVRNPMYVALIGVVLGEALVLASTALLLYGAVMWLITHTFVVLYEEPALRGQFGAEYDAYLARVPRWIPRLSRK